MPGEGIMRPRCSQLSGRKMSTLLRHHLMALVCMPWRTGTSTARASHGERVDIVRLLLEHNADVESSKRSRRDSTCTGPQNGVWETRDCTATCRAGCECALQEQARLDPTEEGVTPRSSGCCSVPNRQRCRCDSHDNDDGWTPLHSASREGHVDIVELLIQHGADVNKQTNNQETPLHLASASGKLEILQLLVERGADRCALQEQARLDLTEEGVTPRTSGCCSVPNQ
jgi:hypothetical protein